MITKERLEELIKQGATIYWICGKDVQKKPLKHKYHKFFVLDNELYEDNEKLGIGIWKHKLSKLFETLEEAEWHKEFGCIERTITLDLPKWEEIEKDKYFHHIRFYVINNFKLYIDIWKFTKSIKIEWHNGYKINDERYEQTLELTKENYTLACRKAKERKNANWFFSKNERELDIYENDYEVGFSDDMFDVLFDLIQAGLVEKVNKGE